VNSDPVLIDKLDSKVLLLQANSEQVSSVANILAQQGANPEVAEYLHLRHQPRIPDALRYTVLAALANKYGLYENNQEPKRVSDLTIRSVEQALGWSGLAGVDGLIVGLQIIRSQYPAIYATSAPGLSSIEKICLEQVANKPLAPALHNTTRREFPITAEFDYQYERTVLQTAIQAHAVLVPKQLLWFAGLLLVGASGSLAFGFSHGYLPKISINFQSNDGPPIVLGTMPNRIAPATQQPVLSSTPAVAAQPQPATAESGKSFPLPSEPISSSNPDIQPTIKLNGAVVNNVDPVSQSINELLKSSLTTDQAGQPVKPQSNPKKSVNPAEIDNPDVTSPFTNETVNQ
jgi:hypothetical protein